MGRDAIGRDAVEHDSESELTGLGLHWVRREKGAK